MPPPSSICARRLRLRGRVQGVGMRPFLAQCADRCGVAARIANDSQGVDLLVEGSAAALAAFQAALSQPPPLARISAITTEDVPATGLSGIVIENSRRDVVQEIAITPDGATCADCRRELCDPGDRRHGHPFITCVNCGPRYSIILDVPYDRPRTTMADFPLCAACAAEYSDVRNRRHHAQPIACPACGPRLWLTDAAGRDTASADPIAAAAQLIRDGAIVAVKGLGGFHLACRADSDAPIARLRERKHRDAKPFALMVADLTTAERLAVLDDAARSALTSSAAPIVCAPLRADAGISALVAPGTDLIGVMLPSTPIHHLVLAVMDAFDVRRSTFDVITSTSNVERRTSNVLVMTSGNPGGEPLSCDNDDAVARLTGTADAFLMHDRSIARPIDDSVVLATDAGVVPVRRARGYVPDPITLPIASSRPILAVGGDLKAALCLVNGDQAVLSEHLGDLENPAAYRHFVAAEERLRRLLRITPQAVACDLHPGYHSVRFAKSLGLPLIPVQHHHAHVAACAAEHGVSGPLIGLACDGTGYGTDGTIWGGEILHVDGAAMTRCAWLRPFPLIGGDAAARDGWRAAAGWLSATLGEGWTTHPAFANVGEENLALMRRRLALGSGAVACSSLGRLFDAMAFLLGLTTQNRHEAEAAMALEQAAHAGTRALPMPAATLSKGAISTAPLIATLLDHQQRGASIADLALAFHTGIADLLAHAAIASAQKHGVRQIALTGGCFLNRILLTQVRQRIVDAGLVPLVHRLVPPGDGGLALGQAWVAAHLRAVE